MTRTVLAGILVAAAAAPALGQTGAPLLLEPWGAEAAGGSARAEVSAHGLFFDDADIDDTDGELGLSQYESEGRIKLSRDPGPGAAIGYEALYLDLDSDDPALPDRLADQSVAFAAGYDLSDDWQLGLVGGVGYAGTRPFADGDGVYFLADIVAAYRIDERSTLTFTLNYNGNRSIWPDLPLPAASYSRRVSDELSFIAGFPYSNIVWEPADRWTLRAGYSVPFTVEAEVAYQPADTLTLFAAFNSLRRGFWLEDDDDRRIFFHQRRLEAGLRYQANDAAELVLAGGWAFSQEFEYGWDTRDTDDVRDIDDAPYLRAGLNIAF